MAIIFHAMAQVFAQHAARVSFHMKRSSSSTSENRAKLQKFGKKSFLTSRALQDVLKTIDKEGLPIAFSRASHRRAISSLCTTETDYGTLVNHVPISWSDIERHGDTVPIQNPLAFFYYNCQKSPHYAELVRRGLEQHPCTPSTPWSLILYQDGVDASDGLAKNHHRKSAIFYWSFKEFGPRALAHEQVWGVAANIRIDECNAIDGNIARVFEKILDSFFSGEHNIRVSGVTVQLDGSIRQEGRMITTMYAKVGIILADIPALKELLQCIGHSGMKFCALCQDCIQTKSELGELLPSFAEEGAVHMNCADLSRFKQHTNDSIRRYVARVNTLHAALVAGNTAIVQNAEDYRLRCQMIGWSWTSANVVLNAKFGLELADCIMYDWAHCYVHDGLGDNEIGQFMKSVPRSLASFEELGDYSGTFTYARCHPDPKHLFTPSANKNNLRKGSFSCTGSEFLTLAPVIHRYCKEVVLRKAQEFAPQFVNHALSMIAVCFVIMLLTNQTLLEVSASQLATAINNHIQLYKAVYGDDAMRPKHHYVLHLPRMLLRHGFLFATFVHERKHRLAKRYMVPRLTAKSFELGVIQDITTHQIWELQQSFFLSAETSESIKSNMVRDAIQDLFPDVTLTSICVITQVACMGGRAMKNDIVSFLIDGVLMVGEMILTIGVRANDQCTMYSIIAVWRFNSRHDQWVNFDTDDSETIWTIPTDECLRGVHVHRMARDRRTCSVHLPECDR